MDEKEVNKILRQIEGELNGDPEHDFEILSDWGERWRGQPGADKLLEEIGRRLYFLLMEGQEDLPNQIYNDMVETADDDYEEACQLIEQGKNEEAARKLLVLTSVILAYPLEDNIIWTDFNNYRDSLVFQDYYSDLIGDREIKRHPMHPAGILYTCGRLLIEMNRTEEALQPLEMLADLDPVCVDYLVELDEAYKRTGQIKKAYDTAMWTLACASSSEELARGYRDLAYCMTESGAYEDAVILYLLSLRYQPSKHAEDEIAWIHEKTGIRSENYNFKTIFERCKELKIPLEISRTVRNNIDFLNMLSSGGPQ